MSAQIPDSRLQSRHHSLKPLYHNHIWKGYALTNAWPVLMEGNGSIIALLAVAAFEPLGVYRSPLEALGYTFRTDNPDRTKRYFRESLGTRRTHIHVRRHGSWSEQFALLFRDFLRCHRQQAAEYAALKLALVQQDRHDWQAGLARTPCLLSACSSRATSPQSWRLPAKAGGEHRPARE